MDWSWTWEVVGDQMPGLSNHINVFSIEKMDNQ